MPRQKFLAISVAASTLVTTLLVTQAWFSRADAEEPAASRTTPVPSEEASAAEFRDRIQPLIEKHCLRCHNADTMESGIRVDQLTAVAEERQIPLLKGLHEQIADGAMPPDDEPQPTEDERALLTNWITRAVTIARSRETQRNGSARRLTVSQYRNTLRDLLGLREDLTDRLPPDAISKDGFANNGQAMVLSPLQVETYFEIAEQALDRCLVDEEARPTIQNFRMELGASINPRPCPDSLILGANSALLNNADFVVTELQPAKPFAYEPHLMRTSLAYIEGYAGNDTVRGWRNYSSIYHSVFACMRGTPGYPKGDAFSPVAGGLLLRPAIPSEEIFGQSDTYGPMANFKISLRELPDRGDFRVTVRAARFDDALMLSASDSFADENEITSRAVLPIHADSTATLAIAEPGPYQVDVACRTGQIPPRLNLRLNEIPLDGTIPAPGKAGEGDALAVSPYLVIELPAGELRCNLGPVDNGQVEHLVVSRLRDDSDKARRFQTFQQRSPMLGVHVGLRRDCGSTLSPVGPPQAVTSGDVQEFVFEGAINDFPSPDVEKDNVNYLAGLREIGVRHEYTDGRDLPRLLIQSIEFEGPYYESWPPPSHRAIFIETSHARESEACAREIFETFGTRAFRRPITAAEVQPLVDVWRKSMGEGRGFRESIKDALLVILTAPQFLFLIEDSRGPESEDLSGFELASKLSYFLWNTAPDQRLLDLAAANSLHSSLDGEISRMMADPRFRQCTSEFVSQWLSLDKFDIVATDLQRFPTLTRETRKQLRREPVEFVAYLIEHNLPLRNLVDADFCVANDVVASYYGLGDRTESGLDFVPLRPDDRGLGGVLTQAAILAGLSDGRESNPVKRGAWLARKIVAEPPDDPPPNVPKLPEDDGSHLTLREKLERHRNQKGCVRCHSGIDPWGLPFETMNAGGLAKTGEAVDAASTLPDGSKVNDLKELRSYLAADRIDQVAFSFAKHVATYATGRTLTYNELEQLRERLGELKSREYRTGDIIRFVILSDIFQKK